VKHALAQTALTTGAGFWVRSLVDLAQKQSSMADFGLAAVLPHLVENC
jgi:hypothetical protein